MPVDEPRSLAQLLPHLASLLAEVPLAAPVAVGVAVPAHYDFGSAATSPAVEFFFRHLDCADVVCALGGFVAPSGWDAFGVVAPGRRLMLDSLDTDLADDSVTVCALLGRGGSVASEVRSSGGETVSHGPTTGRIVDACRRVLGLDTAPPVFGPHVWVTLRWIDRVLAVVLDADLGQPPTWPELALLRGRDTPRRRPPGSAPAHRTVPYSTWSDLRVACANELLEVPGIDPEAADWMDDGLFAREAIGAFAPLVESLGDLRQLLPPGTFDKLVEQVSEQLAA